MTSLSKRFRPCPGGGSLLAFRFLLGLLMLLGLGLTGPASAADDFLEPDAAFNLKAERQADQSLALHWTIAHGYTMYKERLHVRADGSELTLNLPASERKPDPTTGETMDVYHHQLDVPVPLAAGVRTVDIEYQGCADAGLCYPPQHRYVQVAGTASGPLTLLMDDPAGAAPAAGATPVPQSSVLSAPASTPAATAATTPGAQGSAVDSSGGSGGLGGIGGLLRGGSVLRIVAAFFVSGVLLSLTPCVLPMVPILSSIIVGQKTTTRLRGFQLALAYSMGMALVYTALGVAAGLAGEGLAAFLQQPPVLIGFALLLAVLSLSMFDVFTLQVPPALQTRLSGASDRFGGGAVGGAVAMGALSALMVGPCVAAPLAGALLYIGQSRDVVLGGLALFSLACGMSVPLLLTGISAGSLLPRAGVWMHRVKYVFGLMLLAVAWWMVNPLVGNGVKLAGWGLLALASAVFLGLFEPLPQHAGPGTRALRAVVLAMSVLGVMELVGAASGADDPLAPLAPLARGAGGGAQAAESLRFAPVGSVADLDRVLAQAGGKPVMLDFYADWCVACKEMERDTFSDRAVAQAMGGFTLLRADVTANSPEQRELLKRFGLFGPPGLIFFDGKGREIDNSRVIGFTPAGPFLAHLQRVLAPRS